MIFLRTTEAAALLRVSVRTLRQWEQRFDFPPSCRSEDGHRRFSYRELAALRDALPFASSVSEAVSMAKEALAERSASAHPRNLRG